MRRENFFNFGLIATLLFLCCVSVFAQQGSYTYQSCTSGGCVNSSNITLNGVMRGESPGDPARVLGGETFEVCYEVTGWNYINMNWFSGAEPTVGPGLFPPDGNSSISVGGVNQSWIWSSYCTVNCCDGSGDNTTLIPNNVCGPPSTGAWLFGVDSGQYVCSGGSAGDGETSNNWGDSGSSGWEFCLDIETDCLSFTDVIIYSEVGWNVYSHSDMGTYGYGLASNNCGCEGGSEECSIDVRIVCCDLPDVNGAGSEENIILTNGGNNETCTSGVNELSVEGDILNPDYQYTWDGPAGPGPNAAVWDANSSPPLPNPPPAGIYTLTVENTASGDCSLTFWVELFDGANLSVGNATVCAGVGDVVEIPVDATSLGGPACTLPGVQCMTSTDPGNPNAEGTIFIDPTQMNLSQIGVHSLHALIGQTGSSCFSFDTSAYIEVLPPPVEVLQIIPSAVELCTTQPIAAQLPQAFTIQNPVAGMSYAWSFAPNYSDDAIIGTGLSVDISNDFDPDLSNLDQSAAADLIQELYAFPINANGCIGLPSEVELTFDSCDCASQGIAESGTTITICNDYQNEIEGVISDMEQQVSSAVGGTAYLRLTYGGVYYYKSNTPISITGGSTFQTFNNLENILVNNAQASPCQLLQAQIGIDLFCISSTGGTVTGPTSYAPVTLNIYPDIQASLSNGICSTASILNTPCASASSLCIFNATVGSWNNPNNWSGNVLPTQACHVYILNNSICYVLPGTNAQCQTLTVDPSSLLNMDDSSCIDAFGN